MLTIAPQINPALKGNNIQDLEAPSKGNGSFKSVLASLMNDSGGDKSLISEIGFNGNPFEAILQKLQLGEKLLDPLTMIYMQQLLANPQQFQDILKGTMVAGDNNIHLIAQLNQGHFKDLANILKDLTNKRDYTHMTHEQFRQAIMERLNIFEGTKSISSDISTLQTDNMTTKLVDIVSTINEELMTNNTFSSAFQSSINIAGQPLSQSLSSSIDINIKELLTKSNSNNDSKEPPLFDTKSLKLDEKFQASLEDALKGDMASKGLSQELSDLLKQDVIVEELNVGGANNKTIDMNQDLEIITKPETNQIVSSSNTQHSTNIKHEQTVKETVHISRLQDIDSKIFKAIETGQKSLTVRLEPPELGNVHIKLVLADGMVRADMRVESSVVKDMMNLALPQIKNSLENSGIKVSEFFVDIREEFYSDGRGNQHDNNNSKEQRQDKKGEKKDDFKPFEFYI